MATESDQSLQNHTKLVPLFHFVVMPILVANCFWTVKRAFTQPGWETALAALLSVALVLLALLARTFALKAQDRVIRLEMRLRLRELLPADLTPRIAELTPAQLISLRFAGDRELPALTRRVLDEGLQNRKAIKQLITDWQADHHRL